MIKKKSWTRLLPAKELGEYDKMPELMVLMSRVFLDPSMIYAYGLIALFLLLHLIRPKPRHQVMPSLMFLFKDMGRSKATNFLRQLITNLLFLLQLLLLLAIVTAAAKPFIDVSKESLFKSTVIVLDASASMKAPYEASTRFEHAKKIAVENLGASNTIILVKKVPQAALIDESSGKAKEYISKLEASDQPTSLYSSISQAATYARADSRIVVISDFKDTGATSDLTTVKKTLESQGIKVDYIIVSSAVPNIGIVDLTVSDSRSAAVIKNFNPEPARVRLKINDLTEEKVLPPGSREAFTFTTPPRTSRLDLEVLSGSDDFKLDNTAFLSAHSEAKRKVLYITNNERYASTFVYNAFAVMRGIEAEVALPPKIPNLEQFDLYIIKDVDPNLILPGTLKGIRQEVEEKGKAAVIMAQGNFISINYQDLLPIEPIELRTEATNIVGVGSNPITEGLEFGTTKKFYLMKPAEGRVSIILSSTPDKNPLIALNKLGSGSVAYYGLLDEDKEAESYFAKSPAYFVFWKRVADFITNTPTIKSLNYKTGTPLSLSEEQRIDTPKGKVTVKELLLENQGLYTLQDRTIAINLLEEAESDVSTQVADIKESTDPSTERFKEKVPLELTNYLVFAAITLLLLELLYVKFRGDF